MLTTRRSGTAIAPTDGRIEPAALAAIEDALIESGTIKKRLSIDEHYVKAFTPVRL
jgi:hypothetical protein